MCHEKDRDGYREVGDCTIKKVMYKSEKRYQIVYINVLQE